MSDLAWARVVQSSDRELFKRCRREWDLGGRARQNLEPAARCTDVDLTRALRDALAVYYFPGMWEWDRGIVQPLAQEALSKSIRAQGQALETSDAFTPYQEADWHDQLELGLSMLEDYFEWAPTVDRFTPVRVETDFEIDIPDPTRPDEDLTTADGLAIRFRGRIAMLTVDADDVYWLFDHRVVDPEWTDLHLLVLDEAGVSACWAWERFFIGMRIAGVVYNELRVPQSEAGREPSMSTGERAAPITPEPLSGHRRMYAQPARNPDPSIEQFGTDSFRRTVIPRSRSELDQAAVELAGEALDMTRGDVALNAHPTRSNCASCAYRRPCLAIRKGTDPAEILAADYKVRATETEEGRLGGMTWSMNRGAAPPKFRSDQAGR